MTPSVPPDVQVSGVAFSDTDLSPDTITGTVSWTPPDDIAEVSGYAVFLSKDIYGSGNIGAGSVVYGTNSLTLASKDRQGSMAAVRSILIFKFSQNRKMKNRISTGNSRSILIFRVGNSAAKKIHLEYK